MKLTIENLKLVKGIANGMGKKDWDACLDYLIANCEDIVVAYPMAQNPAMAVPDYDGVRLHPFQNPSISYFQVIKVIRQYTGQDLKKTKELVDRVRHGGNGNVDIYCPNNHRDFMDDLVKLGCEVELIVM